MLSRVAILCALLATLLNIGMVAAQDESAFIERIDYLLNNTAGDAQALDALLARAEKDFYSPDSPYRNEELYIIFLEHFLALPSVTETQKLRPRQQLALVMKNRQGSIAADFHFLSRSGEASTLYTTSMPATASTFLLLFFDPACPHCMETIAALYNLALDRSLPVLAVYTEGDSAVWEEYKDTLPPEWTVAIDMSNIVENAIYDLPAMPTLYLLDSDKHVLLKDPTIDQLSIYLQK